MAEQSKAGVCGRLLAEFACSNPAGGMDICIVCVAQPGQSGQRSNADEVLRTKRKIPPGGMDGCPS